MVETFLTAKQWLEQMGQTEQWLKQRGMTDHLPSCKNYAEVLSKYDRTSVEQLVAQVQDKFIKASEAVQKAVIEARGQELAFTHYDKDTKGWMVRDIGKQLYYSQSGMQKDERYLSGEENNPFVNPKVLDNIVNLALGYELTRPLNIDTYSQDSPNRISSWVFTKIGEWVVDGSLNFIEIPNLLGEYWTKGAIPGDKVTYSPSPDATPQLQPQNDLKIDRKAAIENLRISALLDEYVIIKSKWLLLDNMPITPQEKTVIQQETQLFEQSGIMKAELEKDLAAQPPVIQDQAEFEQRENQIKMFYQQTQGQSNGINGIGQYWNYGGVEQNVKDICNLVSHEIKQLREITQHPALDPSHNFSQELKNLVAEKNASAAQGEPLDPVKEQRLRELLAEQGQISCQKFRGEYIKEQDNSHTK